MIFTLLSLLMYLEAACSLQCFNNWSFDNTTYTTNLTYCHSVLAVYERKQLYEQEIHDLRQPNVCETAVGLPKICAFMVARITDWGATNLLFCCCRSDLCNAFTMSEEYEERRQQAPICADNRAMDIVTEKKAVYNPFCYQKLIFDGWNDRNALTWRVRKQEMGPDSQGSNPTKAGYFGCGSGISPGECALTRFYATPMNHLRMISDEHEPAFLCCCNTDHCNTDIPINECWSVYQALDFNESSVLAIDMCGHSPELSWRNNRGRASHSMVNRESTTLQFAFLVVLILLQFKNQSLAST